MGYRFDEEARIGNFSMRVRLKSLICCLLAVVSLCLSVTVAQAQSTEPGQSSPPPFLDRTRSTDITEPGATAYSVWNGGRNQRHHVWFRVLGGDAKYQQRLRVYKEYADPRPPNELPPEENIVQEIASNQPTGWYDLGFESEFVTYYFDGDHRDTSREPWDDAYAVRVKSATYQNGDLYDIRFEDQETLDDYNDLEIEVALVRGQRFPG